MFRSNVSKDYYKSCNLCLIFLVQSSIKNFCLILETNQCSHKIDINAAQLISNYKGRLKTQHIKSVWLIEKKDADYLLNKLKDFLPILRTEEKKHNSELWTQEQLSLIQSKIHYDKHKIFYLSKFANNCVDIDLSKNGLVDSDIKIIADFADTDKINSFNLSDNKLTDNSADDLCDIIEKSSKLKIISLSNNEFGNKFAWRISKIVKKTKSIISINLSNNKFTVVEINKINKNIAEHPHAERINLKINLTRLKNKPITFSDILVFCEYSILTRSQCFAVYFRIQSLQKYKNRHKLEINLLRDLLLECAEEGAKNSKLTPIEYLKVFKSKNLIYQSSGKNLIDFNHFLVRLIEMNIKDEIHKFDETSFKLGKRLGGGTYGQVYEGTMQNIRFAIKYNTQHTIRHKNKLKEEAIKQEKIRNKNIVPVYGYYLNKAYTNKYNVVMQNLSMGSLRTVLFKLKMQLSHNERRRLAIDIVKAILYLHRRKRKIIHRDLKPENILIYVDKNGKYRAKVTDFGEARIYSNSHNSHTVSMNVRGTPHYAAPELLCYTPYAGQYRKYGHITYTVKVDIYSIGILIWDLANFTGKVPYSKNFGNSFPPILGIIEGKNRPVIDKYCLPTFKKLMQKCWDNDPGERPKLEEILKTLKSKKCKRETWRADLILFIQNKNLKRLTKLLKNLDKLLELNAFLKVKNFDGQTPLQAAFAIKEDNYYKIVFLLLKHIQIAPDKELLDLAIKRYFGTLIKSIKHKNKQDPKNTFDFATIYVKPLECFCCTMKLYFQLKSKRYYGILHELQNKKLLPAGFIALFKIALSLVLNINQSTSKNKNNKYDLPKLNKKQQLNFKIIMEGIIIPLSEKFKNYKAFINNPIKKEKFKMYLMDILSTYLVKRRIWCNNLPKQSYPNLIKILASYPDSSGWSPLIEIKLRQWFIQARTLFSSKETICTIAGYPFDSKKTYYIPEAVVEKLFDKNGVPLYKPKFSLSGKSRVNNFIFKEREFFIKFKQLNAIALLGREHLVFKLHSLLGGNFVAPGMALRLTISIPSKSPQSYWAWLSPKIPGNTLSEVLDKFPEKIQKLSPENYTQLFILQMLIYPADAHPGNFIVTPDLYNNSYNLISIDNGEVFVSPTYKKQQFFVSKEYVNLKTVIYLLENINSFIAEKVLEKLFLLNYDKMFASLESEVIKLNKFYNRLLNGKSAKFIDLSQQVMQCIKLKLKILLNTLQRIARRAIQSNIIHNHLSLFTGIDPKTAIKYMPYIGKLQQTSDYYKINPEAYAKHPETGKIYSKITAKHVKKHTLNSLHLYNSIGLNEDFFKKIDFGKLILKSNKPDKQAQRLILELLLAGRYFTELNFTGCKVLTKQYFKKILKKSPKLKKINLANCPVIDNGYLRIIGSCCGKIEEVILDNNPQIKNLNWTNNWSRKLRVVSLRDCKNVKRVNINYPPLCLKLDKEIKSQVIIYNGKLTEDDKWEKNPSFFEKFLKGLRRQKKPDEKNSDFDGKDEENSFFDSDSENEVDKNKILFQILVITHYRHEVGKLLDIFNIPHSYYTSGAKCILGVDFATAEIKRKGITYKLQFWFIGEQECYGNYYQCIPSMDLVIFYAFSYYGLIVINNHYTYTISKNDRYSNLPKILICINHEYIMDEFNKQYSKLKEKLGQNNDFHAYLFDKGCIDNEYMRNSILMLLLSGKKWKKQLNKKLFVFKNLQNGINNFLIQEAGNGRIESVKYLLNNGADVNHANKEGDTPLHYAAHRGEIEIVKYLLTRGSKINCINKKGETALHGAVSGGYLAIVKYLSENGADINRINKDGETPLYLTIVTSATKYRSSRYHSISKYLIAKGAILNCKIKSSFSESEKQKIKKLKNVLNHSLLEIAKDGCIQIIDYLFANGIDINYTNEEGDTALHYARELNIVKYLLAKGAKVNHANKQGNPPLYKAISGGYLEIVKYLLAKGAKINCVNKEEETPLYLAIISHSESCADSEYLEMVEYLIAKGAVLSYKTDGLFFDESKKKKLKSQRQKISNSLIYISEARHIKLVKYLVDRGAKLDCTDWGGDTPLHKAAYKGHLQVVKYLLSKGAKIDFTNKKGETPLYKAAYNKHYRICKYLIAKGANVNCVIRDPNDKSKSKKINIVKKFLQSKLDDNFGKHNIYRQ